VDLTGTGVRGRSPKQLAALVILILMAMVTSFVEIPLIPNAEWLKYDPSGIIAVLATLLYGPWVGTAVAVLAWIPRLVTDPLGAFMNIMASVSMVIVMGLIYRQYPTFKRAVEGACVGVVVSVLVSICLNFVVTPLYLPATYEDVAALVLPSLLPFNVIKAVVNGAVALVVYRKLASLLAEPEQPTAE